MDAKESIKACLKSSLSIFDVQRGFVLSPPVVSPTEMESFSGVSPLNEAASRSAIRIRSERAGVAQPVGNDATTPNVTAMIVSFTLISLLRWEPGRTSMTATGYRIRRIGSCEGKTGTWLLRNFGFDDSKKLRLLVAFPHAFRNQ